MKRRRGAARRQSARTVRNIEEFYSLPFDEQLKRERAFKALSLMRNQGLSRAQAVKEAGISSTEFQRIVGKAVVKKAGRYEAKSSDRYLRVFVLPVPGGKTEVATRSTRVARAISKYDNAVRLYAYTGDPSGLTRFDGEFFWSDGRRYQFLTDRRQLDRLLRAGELSFESIYARSA